MICDGNPHVDALGVDMLKTLKATEELLVEHFSLDSNVDAIEHTRRLANLREHVIGLNDRLGIRRRA